MRPPLQAALLCLFGGWIFLPVADYPARLTASANFTDDIIGTALPSSLLVTKALICPVVVLACLALKAPHLFRTFRPAKLDAAIAAFCLSPLIAWAAGRIPGASGLVQAGYLAVQVVSFVDELSKFHPSDNAYASIYFSLLGAHHVHVALGLLIDAFLLVRLAGGLTSYRVTGLRAAALYWYVVAAVGVLVVVTQVSPS